MDKLKLMTILGTRPEIIRLSEIIKCADKYFNHILVHTGQNYNYTLNDIFFDELDIRKPNYYLNSAKSNLGKTIGSIIEKSYEIMLLEKPDALLILGDTNSALSAISAKRLKIPIFHLEAGNRCWDYNVPEMINRKIVDHISDVNLPYTENSRRYLINEGIDGKNIFVTGSPMKEVLEKNKIKIENNNILEKLDLEKEKYIVLSAHREENIDNEKNFFEIMNAVNNISKKYNIKVVYSMHPRSKKYIEKRNFKFNDLVKTYEPFGFFEYIKLQQNAYCVLSDSGTLSEESAILNFPAILIRTSTERQEVLDSGNIIIGGISEKSIVQSIEMVKLIKENIGVPIEYKEKRVSVKVVKIIQSYTDIINKTIWRK